MKGIDPAWLWLIGGIVLLAAEIVAPGFFLVFIGGAAIAAGLFTLLFGLGTAAQLALFALYAVLAVMVGRRFYANRAYDHDHARLNDPAGRLIGKVVTVVSDIGDNQGRVRVGDGEWSARGGPAVAGETVKITRVDGNCLVVEPAPELPPR